MWAEQTDTIVWTGGKEIWMDSAVCCCGESHYQLTCADLYVWDSGHPSTEASLSLCASERLTTIRGIIWNSSECKCLPTPFFPLWKYHCSLGAEPLGTPFSWKCRRWNERLKISFLGEHCQVLLVTWGTSVLMDMPERQSPVSHCHKQASLCPSVRILSSLPPAGDQHECPVIRR